MTNPKIVISGSFHRHLDEIMRTAKQFADLGADVLSPKQATAINKDVPFVLLDSDNSSDPVTIERQHLDGIAAADLLYVYNKHGYMGDSVKMEIGCAVALGKLIFCKDPVEDVTLKLFCNRVGTPVDALKELQTRAPLDGINKQSSLDTVQVYVRDMVRRRGFDRESPQDILILLIEEVGELAKSVREYIGLKVDQKKPIDHPPLGDEIADVLIYVFHLANITGISIFEAFLNKERKNENRQWSRIDSQRG
jgi:NTP pyrophosphatase (non-canonical NTP hydrolase)